MKTNASNNTVSQANMESVTIPKDQNIEEKLQYSETQVDPDTKIVEDKAETLKRTSNTSSPPKKKQKLESFSFFSCQLNLRLLILSCLTENAFQSNFEQWKNASDKYHAEYMRFEPIWSPVIASKESCGTFYWLYDECLWYRSHTEEFGKSKKVGKNSDLWEKLTGQWYLVCKNMGEWENFLALDWVNQHPTLKSAIKKCKDSFEEDLLTHLDLLSSAHAIEDPALALFETKRLLDIAEVQINESMRQEQRKRETEFIMEQRQVQEQQRIEEQAGKLLKKDILDKEKILFSKVNALRAKDPSMKFPFFKREVEKNFASGKYDFVDMTDLKFLKSLEEIRINDLFRNDDFRRICSRKYH
eukprot:NODE_343_length_9136_cov_0.948656.p4 type:complete len:358 gc:universal NODE_343_length_9136_cov_0.948656:9032-7959(-)